jgi:hypothetical protein
VPAKDTFHNVVTNALTKDGWTVTHDPLRLKIGKKDLYVDLGAERLLAAEKANEKIAVEIKSFLGRSELDDLEKAVGQYTLYHDIMVESEPDRVLFLAISEDVYVDLFQEPIGSLLLENRRLQLIVFEPFKEVIVKWIT